MEMRFLRKNNRVTYLILQVNWIFVYNRRDCTINILFYLLILNYSGLPTLMPDSIFPSDSEGWTFKLFVFLCIELNRLNLDYLAKIIEYF